MIDWMSKTAQFKFSLSEEWQWAKSEAINGGLLLEGNILKISNRGKRIFEKPLVKYIISDGDIKECKNAYEKETGKCCECEGTGQYCYGWDRENGNKYRICTKCKGTGNTW